MLFEMRRDEVEEFGLVVDRFEGEEEGGYAVAAVLEGSGDGRP